MRLRLALLFALVFLPLAGLSSAAMALLQVPAGAQPTASGVTISPEDFNATFDMIDNAYLADSLKLNYQINLLQKMVERQAELNKISQSMGTLGVTFDQPAPPRGICQQLPVNAPCLKAYPDMYPDVVTARKAHYAEINKANEAFVPPEQETAEQKAKRERAEKAAREKAEREARERAEKAAHQERVNRYRWSDITCLNGVCKAVLVASKDPSFRASVHEGSVLNDGTVVRAISQRRIAISINGDAITLRPDPVHEGETKGADAKGGAARPALSGDNVPSMTIPMDAQTTAHNGAPKTDISSALASATAAVDAATGSTPAASTKTGTGTAATPPAASTAGSGAATASGQSVAEPALGPSGLF